ncbi:hypothetical protein OG594_31845 [Streptomyces sp. NBC_01214]|nr:hypothetical protein [Streptomyces sp. NBC_01214]MCX4806156.1 hypothetical protein [Streptomyces sp. NBC_01214]
MAHAKTSYVCPPGRASYEQPHGRDRERTGRPFVGALVLCDLP